MAIIFASHGRTSWPQWLVQMHRITRVHVPIFPELFWSYKVMFPVLGCFRTCSSLADLSKPSFCVCVSQEMTMRRDRKMKLWSWILPPGQALTETTRTKRSVSFFALFKNLITVFMIECAPTLLLFPSLPSPSSFSFWLFLSCWIGCLKSFARRTPVWRIARPSWLWNRHRWSESGPRRHLLLISPKYANCECSTFTKKCNRVTEMCKATVYMSPSVWWRNVSYKFQRLMEIR